MGKRLRPPPLEYGSYDPRICPIGEDYESLVSIPTIYKL